MDREDSVIDFGECSSRTTQWVMENAVEGPDFETEVTEEYVVTDENLDTHESMELVQTQTASRIPKTLVVPGSSFAVPKSIPRRINPVVTVSGQDMAGRKFTPVKAIPLAEAQRLGLVGANGSRSPHVVVIKPGTPGPGFKVVTGQAQVKVMAGTPSSKPVHYVKLEPGRNGSPASHEMLSPNGVPLSSPSVSRAVTRPSADDLSMPPPSPAKSTSGARQKGEVVMLTNPNYPRYAPSGYAASESGRESRLSVFSDLYSRADTLSPTPSVYGRNFENNGLKPRKPCNCNKSQCLKLYCECFANGEFCNNCNCLNCFNNLQHEEERQKAIKACLDRNINAFKPKITKAKGTTTERLHNKGCNCKRSGCLKNYCECFEAKIACSDKCKCLGCKNTEEAMCPNSAAKEEKLSKVVKATKTKTGEPKPPKSFGFMTQDVVEATCQCLLAQAEEAVLAARSQEETERLILEEYGRCLVQIIDYANKVKS